MSGKTRADLRAEIADLERKLAEKATPPNVRAILITYSKHGIHQISIPADSVAELANVKNVLTVVASDVDTKLMQAVRREAIEEKQTGD
jgi:hypothetical protein